VIFKPLRGKPRPKKENGKQKIKTLRLIINKSFLFRSVNGYFHYSDYERVTLSPSKFFDEFSGNCKKIVHCFFSFLKFAFLSSIIFNLSSLKLNDANTTHEITNYMLENSRIKTLLHEISRNIYKFLETTRNVER